MCVKRLRVELLEGGKEAILEYTYFANATLRVPMLITLSEVCAENGPHVTMNSRAALLNVKITEL